MAACSVVCKNLLLITVGLYSGFAADARCCVFTSGAGVWSHIHVPPSWLRPWAFLCFFISGVSHELLLAWGNRAYSNPSRLSLDWTLFFSLHGIMTLLEGAAPVHYHCLPALARWLVTIGLSHLWAGLTCCCGRRLSVMDWMTSDSRN